jgi:hypothetical protein
LKSHCCRKIMYRNLITCKCVPFCKSFLC